MEKMIYHITHMDGDAVGCDVLLRLIYHEFTHAKVNTTWCSNNNISDNIADVMSKINESLKESDSEVYLIVSDISPAKGTEGYKILNHLMTRKCNDTPLYKNLKIFMFDHHVTNPFISTRVNENSIKVILDKDPVSGESISAAMIMYKWLLDHDEIIGNLYLDKLINDISRYDTWEWVNNPSKNGGEDAVTNILRYLSCDDVSNILTNNLFSIANKLVEDHIYGESLFIDKKYGSCMNNAYHSYDDITYKDYLPKEYYMMHEATTTEFNKYMDYIGTKLKISKSGEYLYGLILCDNVGINMSLVTDKINRDILPGVLDYIVLLYPVSRTLSFRTMKETVDVSRIAKRCYGGGGHTKAAGAKVDIPTFTSFLTEYWISRDYNEISKFLSGNNKKVNAENIYELISGEK